MVRATHAQMRDSLQTLQTPPEKREPPCEMLSDTKTLQSQIGGNVPPSKQSRDCI